VLGVSRDDTDTLSRWRAELELPYNLLSDADSEVMASYGVLNIPFGGNKSSARMTRSHFVINEDGLLDDIQYSVSPAESIQKAAEFFTD